MVHLKGKRIKKGDLSKVNKGGSFVGFGDAGRKESERRQKERETVSKQPEEAGTLLRKPSEGGDIPASEVEDKSIGKRILEATFPREDPIRDIALAVLPVGRAVKGAGAAAEGGDAWKK